VTQSKYPGINIFHDDDASQFYYACLGSIWAHGIPKDESDPRLKLFGAEPSPSHERNDAEVRETIKRLRRLPPGALEEMKRHGSEGD
jgi:hypothetical protein